MKYKLTKLLCMCMSHNLNWKNVWTNSTHTMFNQLMEDILFELHKQTYTPGPAPSPCIICEACMCTEYNILT